MKHSYMELLPKTMRVRTGYVDCRGTKAAATAKRIGLLRMMESESFRGFIEIVTGHKLESGWGCQVLCYQQGDYAGPHNDHHPEEGSLRNGYVDAHVTFVTGAVAHQWLVYENRGHFCEMVDINVDGAISVYKLPFWHYTTPLVAKAGRKRGARRWVLLSSFRIVE
jgi:hypothetical protein